MIKNLDKLSTDIQQTVSWYSQSMLQLHQKNLKSITVYGSAASLDYLPKRSNINLLFIFERILFPVLKNSLKLIAAGRKKKIMAPLFLTEQHIISSCDTFPVEFFEIKENHVTIYGEDIFQDLKISQSNLRLQCEQEIKGKLIRLRQSYLEIGLNKKALERLLSNSITALIPAFRTIIRLKGSSIPQTREKIIQQIAEDFLLKEEVFIKVLNLKAGKVSLKKPDLEKIIDDYLNNLHELAQKIDDLQVLR